MVPVHGYGSIGFTIPWCICNGSRLTPPSQQRIVTNRISNIHDDEVAVLASTGDGELRRGMILHFDAASGHGGRFMCCTTNAHEPVFLVPVRGKISRARA